MLKTVVLPNIFVDTFFSWLFDEQKKKKTAFVWNEIFCNIINAFTVIFVKISLMSKSINLFKKNIILTTNFSMVEQKYLYFL